MVCKRFNNSVFIINMITVFYLFIFQVINPPKRHMVYPCELFQSLMLFVKEAFIIISNLSPPPNLSFNMQMLNR